jgi:hypothetical protein
MLCQLSPNDNKASGHRFEAPQAPGQQQAEGAGQHDPESDPGDHTHVGFLAVMSSASSS